MSDQSLPSEIDADACQQVPSEMPDSAERRRIARTAANWSAKLRVEGRDEQTIVIHDATENGFGVTGELSGIEIGQTALLDIEDIGLFRVQVSWRKAHTGGLEILDDAGTLTRSQADSLSGLI